MSNKLERLIILGNGFDQASSLKSKYKNFYASRYEKSLAYKIDNYMTWIKDNDPSFTEEQIDFVFEQKKQGMTNKMIERKTGISIATQKNEDLKISVEQI